MLAQTLYFILFMGLSWSAHAGLSDIALFGPKACMQFLKDRTAKKTSDEKRVLKTKISDGTFIDRPVKYMLPEGTPPKDGWPVVIFSQGSFFPVQFFRSESDPPQIYYEAVTIQALLENGFAVVAPLAMAGFAWQTNFVYFKDNYEQSQDFVLFNNLFQAIRDGQLGPLNIEKLFATGISSGGYNSSRLAQTFPGMFKALAIQSASYATCAGPLCSVPDDLSEEHPPTLLLGGGLDAIVPFSTTKKYHQALLEKGIPTSLFKDKTAGHEWLPESAELILNWFNEYLD